MKKIVWYLLFKNRVLGDSNVIYKRDVEIGTVNRLMDIESLRVQCPFIMEILEATRNRSTYVKWVERLHNRASYQWSTLMAVNNLVFGDCPMHKWDIWSLQTFKQLLTFSWFTEKLRSRARNSYTAEIDTLKSALDEHFEHRRILNRRAVLIGKINFAFKGFAYSNPSLKREDFLDHLVERLAVCKNELEKTESQIRKARRDLKEMQKELAASQLTWKIQQFSFLTEQRAKRRLADLVRSTAYARLKRQMVMELLICEFGLSMESDNPSSIDRSIAQDRILQDIATYEEADGDLADIRNPMHPFILTHCSHSFEYEDALDRFEGHTLSFRHALELAADFESPKEENPVCYTIMQEKEVEEARDNLDKLVMKSETLSRTTSVISGHLETIREFEALEEILTDMEPL